MEYGTPQEKDGTWLSPDGSPIPPELAWRCMQVNALRNAIYEIGQFIPKNMKSESTTPQGHDSGDEDPKAWEGH